MRKNEILVSVIVATYNTEEYLKECLDSLVNQSLKNIEIIVVNDGSTDNSLKIMEEYSKDNRIKVINKKNQGQSIARNIGMTYAKGEYITFVDSDDYIDLDAYEKLYDFAKRNDNDMVLCNALRFNSKKQWKAKLHKKSIPKDSVSSTNIFERNNLVYDTGVWNKFIKKTFWDENSFSFVDSRLYEDLLLSAEIHCAAKSVGIYPKVTYYWRAREGDNKSTTQNTTKIKNFNDRIFVIKEQTKLYNSKKKYKSLLMPHYMKCLEYDLPIFIKNLNEGDENFQKELINKISPLLNEIPVEAYEKVSAFYKIIYQSILENDLHTLKKIVSYSEKYNKNKRIIKLFLFFLNSLKDGILIQVIILYRKINHI